MFLVRCMPPTLPTSSDLKTRIMELMSTYNTKSFFLSDTIKNPWWIYIYIYIMACTRDYPLPSLDSSAIRLLAHYTSLCLLLTNHGKKSTPLSLAPWKRTSYCPSQARAQRWLQRLWYLWLTRLEPSPTVSLSILLGPQSIVLTSIAETLRMREAKDADMLKSKTLNRGLSMTSIQLFSLLATSTTFTEKTSKKTGQNPTKKTSNPMDEGEELARLRGTYSYPPFNIIHLSYNYSPNWALQEGNLGLPNNLHHEQCRGPKDTSPSNHLQNQSLEGDEAQWKCGAI